MNNIQIVSDGFLKTGVKDKLKEEEGELTHLYTNCICIIREIPTMIKFEYHSVSYKSVV